MIRVIILPAIVPPSVWRRELLPALNSSRLEFSDSAALTFFSDETLTKLGGGLPINLYHCKVRAQAVRHLTSFIACLLTSALTTNHPIA